VLYIGNLTPQGSGLISIAGAHGLSPLAGEFAFFRLQPGFSAPQVGLGLGQLFELVLKRGIGAFKSREQLQGGILISGGDYGLGLLGGYGI